MAPECIAALWPAWQESGRLARTGQAGANHPLVPPFLAGATYPRPSCSVRAGSHVQGNGYGHVNAWLPTRSSRPAGMWAGYQLWSPSNSIVQYCASLVPSLPQRPCQQLNLLHPLRAPQVHPISTNPPGSRQNSLSHRFSVNVPSRFCFPVAPAAHCTLRHRRPPPSRSTGVLCSSRTPRTHARQQCRARQGRWRS